MSPQHRDHKAAISAFFAALGEGRWNAPEDILRHMTDDAQWWVAGKTSMSGTRHKAELREMLKATGAISEEGLKITPKSWVIDGDKVAVEAESYMRLRNGRIYNNHYHFAIQMRDGRIASIREYMDTQHAFDTFT
jgi:ketosteroid isomerase-like protein